jgi:hypothetical protein
MAHDRSKSTPQQLASLLGPPLQQLFNAGLRVLNMAEAKAGRLGPQASALGNLLQAAARQAARDPRATVTALATAAISGAGAVLTQLGQRVEPGMTRTLNALQIPTAADLEGLAQRVDALNASVQHLAASRPASKAAPRKRAPARKRKTTRTKRTPPG